MPRPWLPSSNRGCARCTPATALRVAPAGACGGSVLAVATAMQQRVVLYLDLDDTVISWTGGVPAGAPGLREFLLWALDVFEVRWLTRWARDGRMEARLVRDLAKMSGVPVRRLQA